MFLAAGLALGAGIRPSLRAQRLPSSPVIDGKLDDAAWGNAALADKFVTPIGDPAKVQTKAFVGYDTDNIYVAFAAAEPDTKNIGAGAGNGLEIWSKKDDVVALFFKPAESQVYYQFAVNPRAVVYSKEHGGRGHTWECNGLEANSQIGDDGWNVELKIPFRELRDIEPQVGSAWRLNLCRLRPRNNEYSSWAQVQRWNRLDEGGCWEGLSIGLPDSARVSILNAIWPPALAFGRNTLKLAFKHKAEPTQAWVAAIVQGPDGGTIEATRKSIAAATGRDYAIELPFEVPLAWGTYQLSAKFFDAKTATKPYYEIPAKSYAVEPFMRASLHRNYYTRETEAAVLVDIDLPAETAQGVGVRCTLGAKEESISQVQVPTTRVGFPLAGLGNGEHKVTVRLLAQDKPVGETLDLILRKLPPAEHEVKTDAERRCVLVDGKPFFGVGVFNPDTTGRKDLDRLADLAANGINLVMPYWRNLEGLREYGFGRGDKSAQEKALLAKLAAYLDKAHSLGIKIDSDIIGFYKYLGQSTKAWRRAKEERQAWCKDPTKPVPASTLAARERVRYWVNKIKHHPALITHKHFDEISDPGLPEGEVVSEILRQTDPYHPVEVLSESHHPWKFVKMSDVMDADPCWAIGLPNAGMRTQQKVDRYGRAAHRFRRPLWLTPASKFKRNIPREMSGPELRAHTYQCIVAGATGILWYSQFGPNHKGSHEELLKLIKELRALSPMLLEPTPVQTIEQPAGEDYFRVLLKEHQDKLFLVCVNLIQNTIAVDIEIPQMRKDSRVDRFFADAEIQAKAHTFHDRVTGLDTRVYRLTPGTAAPYTVRLKVKRTDQKLDIDEYYTRDPGAFFHPYYRHIVVAGKGNTLASIAEDIDSRDIISYDPATKTCKVTCGLFLCNAAELTIGKQGDPAAGERLVYAKPEPDPSGSIIRVWGSARLNIYHSCLEGFDYLYSRHNLSAKVTAHNSRFTGFARAVLSVAKARADFQHCEIDACQRQAITSNLSPFIGWKIHDNATVFRPGLGKYSKLDTFTFVDCVLANNGVKATSYKGKNLVYVNTKDDAVGKPEFQPDSLLVKWRAHFEVVDQEKRPVPGVRIALHGGVPQYNDSKTTDESGKCVVEGTQFHRQGDADVVPVYEVRLEHENKTQVLRPEWQCDANTWWRYELGKGVVGLRSDQALYAAQSKVVEKKKE